MNRLIYRWPCAARSCVVLYISHLFVILLFFLVLFADVLAGHDGEHLSRGERQGARGSARAYRFLLLLRRAPPQSLFLLLALLPLRRRLAERVRDAPPRRHVAQLLHPALAVLLRIGADDELTRALLPHELDRETVRRLRVLVLAQTTVLELQIPQRWYPPAQRIRFVVPQASRVVKHEKPPTPVVSVEYSLHAHTQTLWCPLSPVQTF
mmetsp:Transcript_8781/g.28883  ORF Transcript_8781/g.28883 Transcript_8781/m.28883 type:complete len:209 (+) Transcript_8781:1311-1937(+)